MHSRLALSSLLGGLLLAFSPAVSAQPSPGDKVKADQLFREGREASRRGEHTRACALFAESQRIDPTAGTLLNLADCSEKLEDFFAARTHLLTALERLKPTDARVALAKERISALEAKLPKLHLRMPATIPAGGRLELDGKEIPPQSQDLVLPAGGHDLVAISKDARRKAVRVQLEQGRTTEIPVEWPAPPPPPASAAPTASAGPLASGPPAPPSAFVGDSAGSWRRPVGFALGGVGVASLLGAAALALVVIPSKKSTVDKECGTAAGFVDPKACTSRGASAAEDGRTWATVFNVGLGLGVVGLGAGAYLVLSAPAPGTRTGATSLGLGGQF